MRSTEPISLLKLTSSSNLFSSVQVSGGPFGVEVVLISNFRTPVLLSVLLFHFLDVQRAVSAGTPLLAWLGFLVFPLIWSLPEAPSLRHNN